MRGRKEAKEAAKEARERANVIKEQAREAAGHSGEALKVFADQTGVAAKEFANRAGDAAKELVEQIQKAAKGVTEQEPKRGRKVLKTTLAIGAGIALFTNERVRNAISAVIRREQTGGTTPEVWRPHAATAPTPGDGNNAARAIAEESS